MLYILLEDQLVDDQVANKILQESYCHITDLLDVDLVILPLFFEDRITLAELDQLQNVNFTNQQRRHILYSTALAGKGKQALDAFLGVLDKTAIQYEPHALLASKLRVKLKDVTFMKDYSQKQKVTTVPVNY